MSVSKKAVATTVAARKNKISLTVNGEPYEMEIDPSQTLAQTLRERGLFVPGIRPPSVPTGECLLRVSLSYLHSDAAMQRLLDAMAAAARTANK